MAAAQMRAPNRRPPPPQPQEIPAEMPWWDWLASFTPDQWNHMIVYPWRVSPMCDRKAAGKPTAIGKLGRKFDIDDILKEFGSGHYRFDVVQIDPSGKGQTRIRQEYVVILNMDYPPRVPLGDWINDPENEMWKWAEEPLKLAQAQTQARIKAIEDGPAQAGIGDTASVLGMIFQGLREIRGEKDDNAGLAGQLLNIVMNNQQAMQALNDPAKQLATLKTLMDSLQPQQRGPDAATMMLDFMKDQVQSMRDEIKDMRATPKRSFAEELKELSTALSEVAPTLGFNKRGSPNANPANGNQGTDWGAVVTQILEKGAPYIPLIGAAIARGVGPQQQQPQPWQPPQIAAQQPNLQQPPQAQPTQEPPDMSQLTPEQKEVFAQVQQRAQAAWAKHQQTISGVAPFMIDRFKAGETGYEFRDWFLDRHGRTLWNQVREDTGPEVFAWLINVHPQLRLILTPPEAVIRYFTEFFTVPGEEPPGVVETPEGSDDEGDEHV